MDCNNKCKQLIFLYFWRGYFFYFPFLAVATAVSDLQHNCTVSWCFLLLILKNKFFLLPQLRFWQHSPPPCPHCCQLPSLIVLLHLDSLCFSLRHQNLILNLWCTFSLCVSGRWLMHVCKVDVHAYFVCSIEDNLLKSAMSLVLAIWILDVVFKWN